MGKSMKNLSKDLGTSYGEAFKPAVGIKGTNKSRGDVIGKVPSEWRTGQQLEILETAEIHVGHLWKSQELKIEYKFWYILDTLSWWR